MSESVPTGFATSSETRTSTQSHTSQDQVGSPKPLGARNQERNKSELKTPISVKETCKEKLKSMKISFESRTLFDASENLLRSRSASYVIKKPPIVYTVLTQPAPDFRPQAYRPNPPKRNSQEATRPWTYATESDGYYTQALKDRREKLHLPSILVPRPPQEYQFEAGCLPIDAHDDRVMQAGETGHLKPDVYRMPKRYDFRGYPSLKSLGLPEFVTSYERDPFNNKLHMRSRRTILGPPPQIVERDIELGIFVPALRQPPKWESRLHHPHVPFPNRPASYTRFRRIGRDPHSAFMDRVTEVMDAKWAKNQYETTLKHCQQLVKT